MRFSNTISPTVFYMLIIVLTSCENNATETTIKDSVSTADSVTKATPYTLSIPKGWTTELISFPIDFAPQINYKGTEELRFAKGWEDITSEEHWCYAFLWRLDGKPVINENILQDNLKNYYTGLVQRNITKRSIPALKIVSTIVKISIDKTAANDTATYKGTISMLDYIAQTPIILNCVIHVKNCTSKNNTAIFFEISPRPFEHDLWKELSKLNESITCNN